MSEPIQESPYVTEYAWFACWCDDDDIGAEVGQEGTEPRVVLEAKLRKAMQRSAPDMAEYFAVELAAQQFATEHPDEMRLHNGHWEIESRSVFKKFLTACRTARKAARKACGSGVPWPDWAVKAKAEGWKPPKGWKP